jgi:hypothetical protein
MATKITRNKINFKGKTVSIGIDMHKRSWRYHGVGGRGDRFDRVCTVVAVPVEGGMPRPRSVQKTGQASSSLNSR